MPTGKDSFKRRYSMLIKVVDASLNCTFLAVHLLSRWRTHLLSRRPAAPTEAQLKEELTAADKMRNDLKGELDHPTATRLHSDQVELWQAMKDASEKCSVAVTALRAHRKAKGASG